MLADNPADGHLAPPTGTRSAPLARSGHRRPSFQRAERAPFSAGAKSAPGREGLSPESLLTDEGLASFLVDATNRLRRVVPRWCPECAWDGAVIAALFVRAHPENFESMIPVFAYARTAAIREVRRLRRWYSGRDLTKKAVDCYENQPAPERDSSASDTLRPALDALPDMHRRTVVALGLEGYSADEFAQAEGIARQTVHNRKCQALRMLRMILTEDAA